MLTMRTSAGLDERRRRLLLRAWRRGTREMDIILGPFANAEIETMSDADLETFEALLGVEDTDLQKWFLGQMPVPEAFDTALFRRVMALRVANPLG